MSNAQEPNYKGLVEYLGSLDIDANRIPEDSVSADGYIYWPDADQKGAWNVTSDGRRNNAWDESKSWPNPEVYKNVQLLLGGADLSEVIEPVNPAKKPVVAKTQPVKVATKK